MEEHMDWADYILPSAINAVLISVKNPAIKTTYFDDPDFQ